MSDKDMSDDNYQTYLKEKHSRFGVGPEIIEDAIARATGAENCESRRVVAGEVNEVYDAKTDRGDFIVRISREAEDNFTAEKWALDQSRTKGVPTPKVLLIEDAEDKGKKVKIEVETKLSGKPLTEASLSQDETRQVLVQAGAILAKIHSVVPKKFGSLGIDGIGKSKSWELFMLRALEPQQVKRLLMTASRVSISEGQIDQALEIIGDHTEIYQGVTPHLIHGDFGPKHILVEDAKVLGVIDFENAKSGDPVWDFAWWSYFGKNRPNIEWLKEGYEKLTQLPDDFGLRLKLYRLRLGVELIRYYAQEKHESGLQVAKMNLIEDLEFFNEYDRQP